MVSCKKKNNESLIGGQFKDYYELSLLAKYQKKADTTFFNFELNPNFGLLHLKQNDQDLVLYSSIKSDSLQNRTYEILDTLSISNLSANETLTIGYCEIDLGNDDNGNIIALVEKTENNNMFVQKVNKAWIANPETHKIEPLVNFEEVDCINEFYNGEETRINYDVLNN